MLTAVVAVGLTALTITAWLLSIASHAKHGTDLANAQLDAVRTGLAAGAGAGAAVGLMLAFRRQHHQEISTVLTDHDATERRITELYTKAVEQLGSDKAPVRLGGLYALARLAEDNQQQRQTIVNVICAYLRMPFLPQAPDSHPHAPDTEKIAPTGAEASPAASGTGDSWQQERQVRLTAQRILADHLRQPRMQVSDGRFWDGIRLDLSGATLIDFDLSFCIMAEALFNGATFFGGAGVFDSGNNFWGATFSGDARFDGATFSHGGQFLRATFNGDAQFHGADFGNDVQFSEVAFSGDARFDRATFSRIAWFDEATFSGDARFDWAAFKNPGVIAFKKAEVLASEGHVWPEEWHVSDDGTGRLTVVRFSSANPRPAAGPVTKANDSYDGSAAVECAAEMPPV